MTALCTGDKTDTYNPDEMLNNGLAEVDDVGNKQNHKESLATVQMEHKAEKHLIYGIMDRPPIHVTIVSGLQVSKLRMMLELIMYLHTCIIKCFEFGIIRH